jgi:ribosomal protein L18E
VGSIRIVRTGGTPKTLEDFLEENPEITTGW